METNCYKTGEKKVGMISVANQHRRIGNRNAPRSYSFVAVLSKGLFMDYSRYVLWNIVVMFVEYGI